MTLNCGHLKAVRLRKAQLFSSVTGAFCCDEMDYPSFVKCLLIIGNSLCFIVSIACLCLATDRWHEYLSPIMMLIITLYGFMVSCQINQKLLLSFTILSIVDFLITLTNFILLIVLCVKWKRFCRGEIYFENDYNWTCHDLNKGDWSFVYAEIGLLGIGLFGRIITAPGAFLLARFYFDDFKENGE